jgi:hypothetical protein
MVDGKTVVEPISSIKRGCVYNLTVDLSDQIKRDMAS